MWGPIMSLFNLLDNKKLKIWIVFLLTNNVEIKNLFYKFDFILLNLSDTIMQKIKENLAMPNLERCSSLLSWVH